jgi:excisionase family DNA binding protein
MNSLTAEPHEQARVLTPKWYTVAEVAQMLGYGISKTKTLVATGQLRSLKDGAHRRILPEWVDDYVARKARDLA